MRNGKFWYSVGVGVAVVVVLIVIGMFSRRGGSGLLAAAAQNLQTANSSHAKAELALHLPERLRGRERPFTEVTTVVEGDVMKNEEGVPELTGTLLVEAKGRGNIFFADGDVRLLSDAVAFRLENLPVLLNPSGSLRERWTYVERPVLAVDNPEDISATFQSVLGGLQDTGTEQRSGQRLRHYTGSLTEEQESQLAEVLRQSASGSPAWHTLARLLQANNVRSFDVWVDPGARQLAEVEVDFVRPLSSGDVFEFATLRLTFSDYNKTVTIDRPERQATVRPEVFAKLFGTGEITEVQSVK